MAAEKLGKERDAMGCWGDLNAHAAFGNTDCADSTPDCLTPRDGPAYLEGRLVLSLSFQGNHTAMQPLAKTDEQSIANADDALERYRLWDDLAQSWLDDDLEVLRFEQTDVVVRSHPDSVILWSGAVDTRARVVPVPDLDEAGMEANRECDLCWRRV